MSSKLELPVTSMDNITGFMNETILFSINFQLHGSENKHPYNYKHNNDLSYHKNNFENQERSNLLKDNKIGSHNRSVMKIPVNIIPTSSHNLTNLNSSIESNRNIENKESYKRNLRCISPKNYEADENFVGFPSRITPPDNGNRYKTSKKGICGHLGDQTVVFGKFSSHSPNMFVYHHNNNGFNRNNSNGSRTKQFARNNSDVMVRRAHGLMERFKSRAYLMRIDPHPEQLLNGGLFDQLSQAMWDVFSSKAQKEETYVKKLNLWRSVFLCFRKFLDNYGLFLVGSTMSGFGLDVSDIDICLLIKPFSNDPRIDSVRYLEHLKTCLLKNGIALEAEVIHAKVPILKFRDAETNFEIDLNCNNAIGIRNTHLLHCYAKLDWRVRPLVIIVKLWAQANNINDAKNMTISSYSWTLMVIHFLQYGMSPPILPCLHDIAPEKFNSVTDNQSMDVQEEIDFLHSYKSDNMCSLGELLLGFLHYFSYFDYERNAISVRTASRSIEECRNMRAPKNDPNQWKYLCIEEPFDFTNTARSVYDPIAFRRIREILRCSYAELFTNRSLNAILPVFVNFR